jgi:hypothetical protein
LALPSDRRRRRPENQWPSLLRWASTLILQAPLGGGLQQVLLLRAAVEGIRWGQGFTVCNYEFLIFLQLSYCNVADFNRR